MKISKKEQGKLDAIWLLRNAILGVKYGGIKSFTLTCRSYNLPVRKKRKGARRAKT